MKQFTTKGAKKYRLKGMWRWVLWGLAALLALMSVAMAVQMMALAQSMAEMSYIFSLLAVMVALPTLGLALFLLYIYRASFLVVDEQGVHYHQPDMQVSTQWHDILSVTDVRYGKLFVKGFTCQTTSIKGGWFSKQILRWTKQENNIPLAPFIPDWHAVLAEYIEQYTISIAPYSL